MMMMILSFSEWDMGGPRDEMGYFYITSFARQKEF